LVSKTSPKSTLYGPTIDSIDIKVLLIEEDSLEIANVEYIASYNWLDSAKPTVLVLGKHRPCRNCDRLPTHQMSNTDDASQPIVITDFLYFNPKFKVLICTRCKFVLGPGTIGMHLFNLHRQWKKAIAGWSYHTHRRCVWQIGA
jgi:hypothetical protein